MNEMIRVSKQGKTELNKTIEQFREADNIEKIENAVEGCKERIYATWASVDIVDKAGENIPIADIIAQQDTLIKRGGPITDNHTNAMVGKTLAYKVMKHPETGKIGVIHLNQIFKDNALDDQVWNETVSGKRTGSSVGGFTDEENTVEMKDGEVARVLNGFHQYETASVYNPANPLALNIAHSQVAKNYKSQNPLLVIDENGDVLKITTERIGKAMNIGTPNLKKDEIQQKSIKTGEGENMTEKDVLKKAIEKFDAGQELTPAEKQALKANMKATDDEEEDKEPEDKKKANTGTQSPPSPEPKDDNDISVFKRSILETQKAQGESIDKLAKAMEALATSKAKKEDDEDKPADEDKAKKADTKKSAPVDKVETKPPFSGSRTPVTKMAEELTNIAKDIALGKKIMINGVKKTATFRDVEKMFHDVKKAQFD